MAWSREEDTRILDIKFAKLAWAVTSGDTRARSFPMEHSGPIPAAKARGTKSGRVLIGQSAAAWIVISSTGNDKLLHIFQSLHVIAQKVRFRSADLD